MSNTSEVNDDSATDVESLPDGGSSKSSCYINWSSASSKTHSSVYSPSSDQSEDDANGGNAEDVETVNRLYLRKVEEYKAREEDCEEEIRNYCRMVHSAPLTLPKACSRPQTLKVIDEKEEFDLSDDSLIIPPEEREIIVTPRQKEIPPKRKCIRAKTPVISTEGKDCFPNKRVNIGAKTYIVRSIRTTEKRSIYTQVEKESNVEIILPHSVKDDLSSNVALEPNIIVLDNKSPSSMPRGSPMGDATLCDENCKPNKVENEIKSPVKIKSKSKMKRNAVGSIGECCRSSSSEISSRSSTNFSVFSIHTSHTSSSNSSSSEPMAMEDDMNDYPMDKKTCRAILGNFSLEAPNSAQDRESFEDLKAGRAQDADTFKEKGTELIKMLRSRSGLRSDGSRGSSNNPGEIRRVTPKSKLLIDTRQEQSMDMEFYDVSSETSQESPKETNGNVAPYTQQIRIDNCDERACCSCLKLLRLKR